jgi:hypothetical protein
MPDNLPQLVKLDIEMKEKASATRRGFFFRNPPIEKGTTKISIAKSIFYKYRRY